MLCLSGFVLYSRWVPLNVVRRYSGNGCISCLGCRIYVEWFIQLPAKEEHMLRLFAGLFDHAGMSSGGGNARKQVPRSCR